MKQNYVIAICVIVALVSGIMCVIEFTTPSDPKIPIKEHYTTAEALGGLQGSHPPNGMTPFAFATGAIAVIALGIAGWTWKKVHLCNITSKNKACERFIYDGVRKTKEEVMS